MKRQNILEYDPRTVVSLTLGDLLSFSDNLIAQVKEQLKTERKQSLYTTKEICELLDINRQTLTKYRTDGLIGYSRQGDKFWYSQQDLDDFIARGYNPPFVD